MSQNPLFELAKDFIVEGLSVRLEKLDNAQLKGLNINTEPRVNYEVNEHNSTHINNNNNNNNKKEDKK